MTLTGVKKRVAKLYLNTQLKFYGKMLKTKKCDLSYLFIPNKKSDKLLVVFSGFSPDGKPAAFDIFDEGQPVLKNIIDKNG